MGRYAGAQIARAIRGEAPGAPFRYRDKGIAATIGRRSAVFEIPHLGRFRGTIAWLAWLGLHLVTLLGGRNRLSALINFSYRYLVWGHGGGVIVGDDPPAAVLSAPVLSATAPPGLEPGRPPEQVPGAGQLSGPGAG
jgi:hypothetical protein